MKKLWQKNWQLDKTVEIFETQNDLLMDQKLISYDIYGSLAQAKMLEKIEVLNPIELEKIIKGLNGILDLYAKEKFVLMPDDEDMHTKIETYLTKNIGEGGKKIHTGRSRNDQVLLAIRLYSKQKLIEIIEAQIKLAQDFLKFAQKYEFVPMPGFTHTQKAMPSSVGMWAGSFTESLIDDIEAAKAAYELNDKNPLGSAAGYGVPLALDREYVTDILGFKKTQINPIYCQNSRGKIEASIIAMLNSSIMTINKFATDMVFFTTSAMGYFSVADKLCSGSSIMPQKKNVDIAELLRSKTHLMVGQYTQMTGIASNLISGYNRDLQETKKILIESLETTLETIKVANILINNITPQKENMEKALTPEIFATHNALEMALKGSSFRDAYHKVGDAGKFQKPADTSKELKKSTHLGGTGNLGLNHYKKTLNIFQKDLTKLKTKHQYIINNLLKS